LSDSYDIMIKNLAIIDGTGRPAYEGSIVIKGERPGKVLRHS